MRRGKQKNDLKDFGGQPAAGTGQKPGTGIGPLSPPPPPGTLTRLSPGGHFHFATGSWRRERVQRLARMFRCIERGRARGKRVHEQLVWYRWRWNGEPYRSDPARRMQFSYGTLVRLYYRWRAGGQVQSALEFRYRCGRQKLGRAELLPLLRVCVKPEVSSFAAAYRQLANPIGPEASYRYASNVMTHGFIRRLFLEKRKAQATGTLLKERFLVGADGPLAVGT